MTASPPSLLQEGSLIAQALFPTALIVARLADHEQINQRLAAAILAQEATAPGINASNVGGYHSRDFEAWSGAAAARLLAAAREMVDRMTLMDGPRGLVPATLGWRISAWANVVRAGHSHKPHAHPAAFWSGVYWVEDGGAGEALGGLLEFSDPRGILPDFYAPHLRCAVQPCLNDGRGEAVTPEAGILVLFPSWLVHAVTPYRGERTRISVAFNFSICQDPTGLENG